MSRFRELKCINLEYIMSKFLTNRSGYKPIPTSTGGVVVTNSTVDQDPKLFAPAASAVDVQQWI
jgi:hypothetical protein